MFVSRVVPTLDPAAHSSHLAHFCSCCQEPGHSCDLLPKESPIRPEPLFSSRTPMTSAPPSTDSLKRLSRQPQGPGLSPTCPSALTQTHHRRSRLCPGSVSDAYELPSHRPARTLIFRDQFPSRFPPRRKPSLQQRLSLLPNTSRILCTPHP